MARIRIEADQIEVDPRRTECVELAAEIRAPWARAVLDDDERLLELRVCVHVVRATSDVGYRVRARQRVRLVREVVAVHLAVLRELAYERLELWCRHARRRAVGVVEVPGPDQSPGAFRKRVDVRLRHGRMRLAARDVHDVEAERERGCLVA